MIWCVEDDTSIREIILYTLRSTGFEARGFESADLCWDALQEEQPLLILLDGMLPGMDGTELLGKIRGHDLLCHIPVIMESARGSEFDKIRSLDIGADDYLVKPFGMMEMVSRIKAVLRRSNPQDHPSVLQLDGLTLNPQEHTVTLGAERVSLTYKEFALLHLFLSHPGIAFTREQLLAEVWNSDYLGQTRTVDMHIRTLRQKLGAYGGYIETVRGVGYRLEVCHDR